MKSKHDKNFHPRQVTHGMQFGIETGYFMESGSICLCTMGWFIRNLGSLCIEGLGITLTLVGLELCLVTVIELKKRQECRIISCCKATFVD
jgi:hypothetical protein